MAQKEVDELYMGRGGESSQATQSHLRLSTHAITSVDVEHARGGRLSVAVEANADDRCAVLRDKQGEGGAAQVAAPIGGVVVPLAVRAAGRVGQGGRQD